MRANFAHLAYGKREMCKVSNKQNILHGIVLPLARCKRPNGHATSWCKNHCIVDISYAAPQAHVIVNVALQQVYSPGIVFIFSQWRKDLNDV
jgi:hypothetical protein